MGLFIVALLEAGELSNRRTPSYNVRAYLRFLPRKSGSGLMTSRSVLIDRHPGRSAQTIGVARALGTDPDLIHEPSVGVVGAKGDSQCYLGVMAKVEATHAELKSHLGKGAHQLKLRLVQQEYTIA